MFVGHSARCAVRVPRDCHPDHHAHDGDVRGLRLLLLTPLAWIPARLWVAVAAGVFVPEVPVQARLKLV